MTIARRALLTAAASTSLLPRLAWSAADPYDVKMSGDVRIIHQTDTHANARPVHFREPTQNIGVGRAAGQPPHLVGAAFLDFYHMKPGTRDAHAFTFLDFEALAHRYGRLGGFASLKTVIDNLRAGAGPGRSILLDGGDLCQGTGIANLTRGQNMVALGNLLGIDAMTGHWEFTYGQDGIEALIKAMHGRFIAQNVFLSAESQMMGAPAFDQKTGRVFQPSIICELGGYRVGVIGQAFPYVPIAHPRRFTPDWRFGIHPGRIQKLVDELRAVQKVDAVLLLSHNGMPVDLKLASQVRGIDVILGGHTHDAVPHPVPVKNPGGITLVTNAGTGGKFVAILDLELTKGRVRDVHYRLLPIYADQVKQDAAVVAAVEAQEAPHRAMLDEKLAETETLLYRRNNFYGSVDQVIMDALRAETGAQIAFSPGFRWGNTVLGDRALTMGDLLAETAITYPMVYKQTMTGAEIKAVMEDVCDNLFNPNPYYQQGGDMIRVGGMNYACAPGQSIGHRISAMELDNGTKVEAAKQYTVASWASVSLPQTGAPVWDVVARHLRQVKTVKLTRPNRVKVLGLAGNPGYAVP
ncbi:MULTISPECIES: thiosulfohydrolase SoxB [unclassified Acidiphilium]|jgi:sulfur-oxidizing protein SoxB|uniref:thiosulfohydrolase SoxB n=1 Tax=unclassified Acidiphilium TaxID=2617493 RepID=UPI000BCE60D2|nr:MULTISPECIES: thiosulfohydrolase SoxB [unclassified Acidiphilium]OYV55428.1 MAG: thiosulfohydrolase SoxB [Acidiphilium sp. 20-67-58]HQT60109.1 thiosulfohydrolase SoxB [Acidiphilium sp.]